MEIDHTIAAATIEAALSHFDAQNLGALLAQRIAHELQSETQHAVYEQELTRIWPLPDSRREAKIAQFATERGWRLRFYQEGLCAIFDKSQTKTPATIPERPAPPT